MIRTTFLALVVFSALASQAMAAPDLVTRSVHVSYGDLNLDNAEGAKSLNRRIRAAADVACGGRPENDLREISDYSRCMHEAVANAVDKVRSPQLSALNGRDVRILLANR